MKLRLRARREGPGPEPGTAPEPAPEPAPGTALGSAPQAWFEAAPVCRTCGTPLDGVDPDEDPTGDDGWPICGNCYRERDFFVMDAVDGVLDGRIDFDPDDVSDDDHDADDEG